LRAGHFNPEVHTLTNLKKGEEKIKTFFAI
jgi:hypothetical protein